MGPPGVGRRALVQRIVAHNPKIFDTIKAGLEVSHKCYHFFVGFHKKVSSRHWSESVILKGFNGVSSI